MWKNRAYNALKLLVGVSACHMSIEYLYFWLRWREIYYILDLALWLIFGGIMIGESFIELTKRT